MTDHPFFSDSSDEPPVQFHFEDVAPELPHPDLLIQWIQSILHGEDCRLESINFIFCTDEYLHRINLEYLNHDTYTDIITFPYQDPPTVEGDIFISIERVRENAITFQIPFQEELHRVMIHGVLHLCGLSDKTPEEKSRMREKENQALELLSKLQK